MVQSNEIGTRRRFVSGTAGVLIIGLSGCIGDDADDDHHHDDDHDHADDHDDDHEHHDDDAHGTSEESFDEIGIGSFHLLDRSADTHEEIADVHDDHWHGDFPVVSVGDYVSVGAAVEDEDGEAIEIGDKYELRASVADDGDDAFVSFDHHGDHVHVHGEAEGIAEIVFLLWHDDHADYQTPPLTVQVTEE